MTKPRLVPPHEMANLTPALINMHGLPTRHEFVGFQRVGQDGGGPNAWYAMFRCTETGEARPFGCLHKRADMAELYGTTREWREF